MNTPETTTEFQGWPKIARLNRQVTITEKIDGTNAQVAILPIADYQRPPENVIAEWVSSESPTGVFGIFAGSRTRWVTPDSDNYGFATWVLRNHPELKRLGPGRHFGEWWGRGINRNYGLTDRRFSLFNTERWCLHNDTPRLIPNVNPKAEPKYQVRLPECVGLVPVLYRGNFDSGAVNGFLNVLKHDGSQAAPGFMQPEGVVVFHHAANTAFKVTLENDESPKGLAV